MRSADSISWRDEYARILVEHVIEPWFPRCIDREFGGFLCDFDRRWRPAGPHDKLLEFQARQTLTAAELLLAFPADARLAEAIRVGFAFLRDVMWDHEYGGWYWLVDRAGRPIAPEPKHLHGVAYAIQACLAVFSATGDPQALELARRAFVWMDDSAHDNRHGGYFELVNRDGSVSTADSGGPERDHIGTPLGQKDMNVHSDLLEALTYFCARSDDQLVRRRLEELIQIILTRYAAGPHPWYVFQPDWTPASTLVRPANALQTASRLIEARPFSSEPRALEAAALWLVEYAFAHGWHSAHAALVLGRFIDREMTAEEADRLPWWPQFEALKALDYCIALAPAEPRWPAFRSAVRKTLLDHFIDRRRGGIFESSAGRLGLVDRIFPTARRNETLRKGGIWKDASHDGRVLLRLMSPSGDNLGHFAPVAQDMRSSSAAG